MEQELIAQIRQKVGICDNLELGIGDDAAILRSKESNTVVTVDLLTEDVDFEMDLVPPEWIGRKALAVNLSDLAAMAAIPHSIVIAVALPKSNGFNLAQGIMNGIFPLASEFGVSLAGGDVNSWDGKLVLSITAIGLVSQFGSFRRSGAQPGDRILTTGRFGGSILERQFFFLPRIQEAQFLNEHYQIHAAIDVSDGLLLDLSRLARESCVGFQLFDTQIPIHSDVFALMNKNTEELERISGGSSFSKAKSPLTHALEDGEDFELILAVDPSEATRLLTDQPFRQNGVEMTEIGFFCNSQDGCCRIDSSGNKTILQQFNGFLHQFRQKG
ncbi:MAG: thiamine-phosphate kinase [Planctomycetia bacterium]|nr:thiamine-phosphate kinase [Planctomycetia bacterium]